jgi:LysR family hydrogen peroxide-inducible transcriptional activator
LRAFGPALPTGEVEKETIELDALFVAFPKDDPRDPPAEISPDLIDENRCCCWRMGIA